MNELLISTAWEAKENESQEIYTIRIEQQKQEFRNMRYRHGNCYMVKFNEGDIRPMWEDQMNLEKLRQEVYTPTGIPLDCPMCQPYDHWDPVTLRFTERRYLTKIIHFRYPEGFIDKEGVFTKCPCLIKGENRKRLKFLGMSIQP